MVRLSGDFDAHIAAAAGDDPALFAELRAAFADSFSVHLDLLRRARCDGNWAVAAQRLKILGASFHVGDLVDLAEEALDGAPGDPRAVRRLSELHERFTSSPQT